MIRIAQSHRQPKQEINFLTDTLAKTKTWLKEIQREIGLDSPREAYAALRAVLHAIRDRLSIDEAARLGGQLPTLIRGSYYGGWDPNYHPQTVCTVQEFLDRIAQEIGQGRLSNGSNAFTITEGVLKVLSQKITVGEMDDIKSSMPSDILNLWPEQSAGGHRWRGHDERQLSDEEDQQTQSWREDRPASLSSEESKTSRDVIAWDEPD